MKAMIYPILLNGVRNQVLMSATSSAITTMRSFRSRLTRVLEEEEPLIQAEYIEAKREIRVHSMGDVYLEVLARQLKDRFGIEASFADSSVLYRETIEAPVEGVGHYEPLRHYAEVHLLLSPLPRGSGLQFDSAVHVDDLSLNWQRLIMTHLREKTHIGVLTGSPITDMRITLGAGKAHLKHGRCNR